jgi:hypothetical protein
MYSMPFAKDFNARVSRATALFIAIACAAVLSAPAARADYRPGLNEDALRNYQKAPPTAPKLGTVNVQSSDAANLKAIQNIVQTYKTNPTARTLPLASNWNGGLGKYLYSPEYQMDLLANGAYIMPWMTLSAPGIYSTPNYYRNYMEYLCANDLPVTFLTSQWEELLSTQSEFKKLSAADNPNIVSALGVVENMVRPDGRGSDWFKAGQLWGQSTMVQGAVKYCPTPALVLFLSNNEHPRQSWCDNFCKTQLGMGIKKLADDDAIRKQYGDKWINLYNELIRGFRTSLPQAWQSSSRFIAYNSFVDSALGRYPGWVAGTLQTKGRIEPWMDTFQGTSVEYYLHDWSDITDFKIYSPQVESMNFVPVLADTLAKHPDFWFEMSIWDGYETNGGGKRQFYKGLGQTFDECRYQGYSRFGAWVTRPRVLREFRSTTDYSNEKYFNAILNIAHEVNTIPQLADFWLNGDLIENPASQHPYQSSIPPELTGKPRWFLLDVNTNSKVTGKLTDTIEVYALALNQKSNNTKLLYVYAPQGEKKNVGVTVPGFGVALVNATPEGNYYVLTADNKVQPIAIQRKYKTCGG